MSLADTLRQLTWIDPVLTQPGYAFAPRRNQSAAEAGFAAGGPFVVYPDRTSYDGLPGNGYATTAALAAFGQALPNSDPNRRTRRRRATRPKAPKGRRLRVPKGLGKLGKVGKLLTKWLPGIGAIVTTYEVATTAADEIERRQLEQMERIVNAPVPRPRPRPSGPPRRTAPRRPGIAPPSGPPRRTAPPRVPRVDPTPRPGPTPVQPPRRSPVPLPGGNPLVTPAPAPERRAVPSPISPDKIAKNPPAPARNPRPASRAVPWPGVGRSAPPWSTPGINPIYQPQPLPGFRIPTPGDVLERLLRDVPRARAPNVRSLTPPQLGKLELPQPGSASQPQLAPETDPCRKGQVPKRKQGQCRTGFFREYASGNTRFTTWDTRGCGPGQKPRSRKKPKLTVVK